MAKKEGLICGLDGRWPRHGEQRVRAPGCGAIPDRVNRLYRIEKKVNPNVTEKDVRKAIADADAAVATAKKSHGQPPTP